MPEPGNPQAFNKYSYVNNRPVLYNDPSGHCAGLCVGIGLAIFLFGTSMMVTADTPLPPDQAPPPEQGLFAALLMLGGAGIALAPEVAGAGGIACSADPSCGHKAVKLGHMGQRAVEGLSATGGGATASYTISKFAPSNLSALTQFANEAPSIQAQRGFRSFGSTWAAYGQTASQSEGLANNLFLYQTEGKVMGAMRVADASSLNALQIKEIEGLGEGVGTSLMQTAVQESMNRGYGGRIVLYAAEQATSFYENLGGVLINSDSNQFLFDEQAAQALLQMN